MSKQLLTLGVLLLTIGIGWYAYKNPVVWEYAVKKEIRSPISPQPTPLVRYSFESLRNREYRASEIKLERVIKDYPEFTANVFSYVADGKKITGQLNLPKKEGKLPLVIMVRGYADKDGYFTGSGSHKAAAIFAKNGFITVAPDFLGFGGSDPESTDILEVRFEKPIAVLILLASVNNIKNADANNIFFWAHSNGGQITLSVLEITKRSIPTTLWAPVTRGFPQGVVDFIDTLNNQSMLVVSAINSFVKSYDAKLYSIDTYLTDIQSPMQLHQGTLDSQVKEEWSQEFVQKMRGLNKSVSYYSYKRDDHNLKYNWDTVVSRDIEFFKRNMR